MALIALNVRSPNIVTAVGNGLQAVMSSWIRTSVWTGRT